MDFALATPLRAAALGFWLLAGPGLSPGMAQDGACPSALRDGVRERHLIDELRTAPNASAARRHNAALWELWTAAPDDRAQDLLDSGMHRIRLGDLASAVTAFDALVDYCPDYAEGYNQRAFALYLAQDYSSALDDLDQALALSPLHVGALSGKALTLIGLGRDRDALDALNRALELNPFLSEGALVPALEKRLGVEDL